MTIRPIESESEFNGRFERPYNPVTLTTGDDERDYYQQWERGRRDLSDRISVIANDIGVTDEFAFGISDRWTRSRGYAIELCEKLLFHPRLVPEIQSFLHQIEPEYEVFVSHDLLDEEPLYLFITRNEVAMWPQTHPLLEFLRLE